MSRPFVAVRLPAVLASANLAEHDFEDDATYQGLAYLGLDLSVRKAESMEVSECRFADSKLSGSSISKVSFSETVVEKSDLANIGARDSSFLHARVSDSRMTGSSWSECLFRDTLFDECRMDLTSFRFARFKRTIFRNCNLQGADFQNADLRRISFESCNLRNARFANAQLEEAKFANCDLLGIGGVTSFHGAIIDSNDLPSLAYSLASALGITVA